MKHNNATHSSSQGTQIEYAGHVGMRHQGQTTVFLYQVDSCMAGPSVIYRVKSNPALFELIYSCQLTESTISIFIGVNYRAL